MLATLGRCLNPPSSCILARIVPQLDHLSIHHRLSQQVARTVKPRRFRESLSFNSGGTLSRILSRRTMATEAAQTYQKALSVIESSKRLAAYTAVDQHVKPEHRIIGIGSGSTVPYVVERIVQQGPEVNANRVFIPTGFQSKELIISAGLTLGDIDAYHQIDVTIDGADEVDHNLHCIKGGGACQLREKVLAEAAKTFIVVADFRKNSEILGTTFALGVPVEVVPFAYASVLRTLREKGSPKATLRMAVKKAGPVVTDNGNFVIDAPFDKEYMQDPPKVLQQIKLLTGVVEVGLFCNIARAAYFGNEDGSVTIKKEDGSVQNISAS